MRRGKLLKISLLLIALVFSLAHARLTAIPPKSCESYVVKRLVKATLRGPITPISEEYIKRAIKRAESGDLIIIELNTPGGTVSSTREIVEAILSSRVPVVVFVYPPGGHAASAGSFILLAAHVALMAPGTNVGSAHPIIIGDKGENEIALKKAKKDLVAWAKALAELRGRDKEVAAKLVLESESLTPEEALGKVIEGIAKDEAELLKKLDNFKVKLGDKCYEIRFSKKVDELEVKMTKLEEILQVISSPEIAYLLITLGTYLVIIEVFHFTGGYLLIIGALLLITGFTGLGVLSFNAWGLILLLAGIVMTLLEIKLPTHGALALSGVILALIGSITLFRSENLKIEVPIVPIALITGVTLIGLLAVLVIALRTLRKPTSSGREAMIGKVAEVRKVKGKYLVVELEGVLWRAVLRGEQSSIKAGTEVKVVEVRDDLTLVVSPLEEASEDESQG